MSNLEEIKKSPEFIEKTQKSPEYIAFLKTRISDSVKPEVAQNMLDFALSEEEHARALDRVAAYCFNKKSPSAKPTIYLVVAQTGAGKSNLSMSIQRNNNNVVLIDSDAFKAFNPLKDMIISYDPTHYGFLTGLDAYLHRDEVYDYAIKNGYDILIEVAPSTKDRLFSIDFDQLKEHGYNVEAHCLAVSEINSLLSVHERYETQIKNGMEAPKLTDLKRAIDSYNAVELILEDLLTLGCENINVYRRADLKNLPKDVPVLEAPTLISTDPAVAMETLREVRKQDHDKTLAEALERIEDVENKMKARKAPQSQFDQFEEIKKKVFNYLKIKPE